MNVLSRSKIVDGDKVHSICAIDRPASFHAYAVAYQLSHDSANAMTA